MLSEQEKHYQECIAKGTSPRLAEMFATGQAPTANTDREFLHGHANGSQFEDTPHLGDVYAAVARAHGQDPQGKVYLSGLARFPGDPQAWVSGKGEAQQVIERNGWGSEGAISRPVTRVAEPLARGLDPALVEQEVAQIVASVDEPQNVDVDDLREQVIEKRKPHWTTAAQQGEGKGST